MGVPIELVLGGGVVLAGIVVYLTFLVVAARHSDDRKLTGGTSWDDQPSVNKRLHR